MLTSIPSIGEFFKIPINLFFFCGFCVRRWTPKEKKKSLQFLLLSIYFFHISFDFVAMAAYLFFGVLETSLEVSAYIIYTAYAGNALLKYLCCFLSRQKLREALKILENYYPKTRQERKDYKLDEHLKRIRLYNKYLTFVHFSVTVMFSFFPLMQNLVFYYQSEERNFIYELPFPMIYLFDTNRPLTYTIAYTTQCSGVFSASFAFLASDLLVISCVHLTNMNFYYLNKIISEYKPNGTPDDMKALRRFLTYHNDILRAAELIDETFNISIFLNYFGSVLIICLLGFQLVVGTSFLDLIKFLSFLISILTHVFFISLFGNEMITLSTDISEAFAHHAWYDGDMKYKRFLPLAISRAQRPALLHASKFLVISMETFKELVSVSYQFFTLIKTRYVEE